MKKLSLCGAWVARNARTGETFAATVPGCVHTDLQNAGLIGDFYYRDNAESVQWIENETWVYEKTFDCDETEGAVLVFEGLDTYCDVYLNGRRVGETENMFLVYRFDVSKDLKIGENKLLLVFHSAVKTVEGKPLHVGAFTRERMNTRRIQCTYGWDWVARFVTCGVYRPVYLQYEKAMRCESAFVYTKGIDAYGAEVAVRCEFACVGGALTVIEILDPAGIPVYRKDVYLDVPRYQCTANIAHPVLWDVSNAENKLYTLRVTVGDEVFTEEFGIRTLRVLQLPDAPDSPNARLCKALKETESGKVFDKNEEFSGFEVLLNGRRVMCKGADWVPCEPFPSAETPEKITRILTLCKKAGFTFVRVWGGGIVECDHFYRECDRLGLLVMQDFLMACGTYPEDEVWFVEELQKEARLAAKRLRNHPCLAWYSGDNENATMGHDAADAYNGRISAFHGALPVLMVEDPTRPLFTSSPYGGILNASKTVGTTHNTNFLDSFFRWLENGDMTRYLENAKGYSARFIAEEPCFGAASYESLSGIMTDADIYDDEAMWLYHSKTNPGLPKHLFRYYADYAASLFGSFADGRDRLFKLQYLQYEQIRISMENARRLRGFCGGLLYWMLADCWPSAAGWSIIDWYARPKAAYYAFGRAAAPLALSLTEESGKLVLYLGNDTDEAVEKTVRLTVVGTADGLSREERTIKLRAEAQDRAATVLGDLPAAGTFMTAALDGDSASRTFFKPGLPTLIPAPSPEIVARSGDSLALRADRYLHAVRLSGADVFEDNYFSLLAGETRTIRVEGDAAAVSVDAYTFA